MNNTATGTINAVTAELKAAGGNIYALAINNGGVVRATGLQNVGGHIYLTSGGAVSTSGTLDASGSAAGGQVIVTGSSVNVQSGAVIAANGGTNGGTILIGGDIHGGSVASENLSATPVATAQQTTVAQGAQISANGGVGGGSGNGGSVVVWSDQQTNFQGAISARGGAQGGNGGFAEVSSKGVLNFAGTADLRAPFGSTGTLLLDPTNLTIDDAAADTNINDPATIPDNITTTGTGSVLSWTTILTELGLANVNVSTASGLSEAGNITIAESPNAQSNSGAYSAANNLLLQTPAGGTIFVNAPVVNGSTGTITFNSPTIDFGLYGGAVSVSLTGANAGTATGLGGTYLLTGVSAINANSAKSNTMGGTGLTYALDNTTADKGSADSVTWTAFKNISDATGSVNFGTGGSVTGSITANSLDYSSYGSDLTVTFTGNNAGTVNHGIGGNFSGVYTITANTAKNNTAIGSGQNYYLDNTTANEFDVANALCANFQNISDSTGYVYFGTAASLSGNVTAQTLDYVGAGYASNVTVALTGANAGTASGIGGTFSGVTTITANSAKSNTMGGSSQTYTVDATTSNKGSADGVTWTAFQTIADAGSGTLRATGATWNLTGSNQGTVTHLSTGFSGMANLTDLGTGDFVMHSGANGSITGNLNAGTGGTLDYSGYGTNVSVTLTGANAGNGTGIGGAFSGVSAINATGSNNTMGGSGLTYALDNTTANKGSADSVTWTAFQNISDATGTVNFGTGGSVSGTIAAATLNYSTYGSNVTVGLTGANAGGATGIGGTFSGVSAINANVAKANTMGGSSQTYTVDATTSNKGSADGVTWTAFQTIADAGSGTLRATGATWDLTGSNQGTVTHLSTGFSGMANLTDLGTGDFVMHSGADGSITGNLNAGSGGTLDYTNYSSGIGVTLTGANAGTATGIGGTFSGVSAINAANLSTNWMEGSGLTYALDNTIANKGSAEGVTWTNFTNISDTTGTVNFGTGGSVTGQIIAATLDYSSYATPVTFDLNGGPSTGIGFQWAGVTTVTGSANSDTMGGTNQTYTVTGVNAGNNGTVSWTSFENLADSGVATLKATGATWILTGSNQGTVTNLSGSFSGMTNLTDLGTGTLEATSATWNLTGSNQGTVTPLSGSFHGMANLTDLGTGIFNMHSGADGSITGTLFAGTNGSISYAGYTTPVTFNLGGTGTTGIGGTWNGVTTITVTGSPNNDTIIGLGQTYNLTALNAGNSLAGAVLWTSFENVTDTGAGTVNVSAGGLSGNLNAGNAGSVTISGGATFAGTVNTGTASVTATTGTIAFQGNTTVHTGLTTAANAYNLSFTGNSNTIAGATSFLNTGTLTVGGSGTSNTFSGGATATAPTSRTLAGTITGGAGLTFGASTLGANTTLDTSAVNAAISLGAVTGATHNLTVKTGSNGVTGTSVSGVGTLALTSSGTDSFSGSVGATTADLSGVTGGSVAFNGGLTATTLTTGSGAYGLTENGGTITNTVTYGNTGALSLTGVTFTGGATATASSSLTLVGTITGGAGLTFGASTLGADTTLDTSAASAAISLGAVTGATHNLTVKTGTNGVTGTSIGGVGTLALTSSGTDSFSGSVGATTADLSGVTGGSVAFNGGLTATTLTTGTGAYGLTENGGTITNAVTYGNTGALSLTGVTFTGGATATAPSSRTLAGIITGGAGLTFGASTLGADTTLDTSAASAAISIGAVTGATHNLTVKTGTNGVTGTSASGVGTLALYSSGADVFSGSVGATTANLSNVTGGSVAFNGGLTATTLTTGSGAYGLTENGGTITNAVTYGNTGALNLTGVTFTGGATATAPSLVTLSGTISSTNSAFSFGPVALAAGTTVSAGNAAVNFGGAVNGVVSGADTLAVNTTGTATFSGAVGTVTPLASLTMGAGGTTAINGGAVTTTVAQFYNSAVTLGANTTLTTTANGSVSFLSTLDSATSTARNLTVSTGSGGINMYGNVGLTQNLGTVSLVSTGTTIIANSIGNEGTHTPGAASLTVNGPATLSGGFIGTSGAQDFKGAVTLGATMVMGNTGGAAETFESTIDGGYSLSVVTDGTTTFSGAVGGSTPLTDITAGGLTTPETGSTVLSANVTTNGINGQTLNNVLTLGATVVLNDTYSGASGLGVTFNSSVNSAASAGNGLTINGPNFITFNNVTSSTPFGVGVSTNGALGALVLNGAVYLNAASGGTAFNSASATFVSSLNSTAHGVTVTTTGATIFEGPVNVKGLTTGTTGTTEIAVAGGGTSVTTTNGQNFQNPVILGANTTLATTNSPVVFASTLDSVGSTAENLTVNAGSGAITATGAVGGTHALGAIAFNSTSATTLTGAVTATSLTTNAGGTTAINGGAVTTTGIQTYNDAVTLGANTTLATTNSAITFASTLDSASSTAENLTVNAGSGAITATGAIGGTNPLGAIAFNSTGATTLTSAVTAGSLTTDAGGTTAINGGAVTTTGIQTYNDAVTLGASTTLTTTNSAVTFGSTLDSATSTAENLTVNAGSGTIATTGTIGGSYELSAIAFHSTSMTTIGGSIGYSSPSISTGAASLTVYGPATLNGGSIITDGAQDYKGAVTLGTNVLMGNGTAQAETFESTIDGAYTLQVKTDGLTTFDGTVGGTTPLGGLIVGGVTTPAAGATFLNANVTTTLALDSSGSGQTWNNAVTLGGGDPVLIDSGGANIVFASTVDGANPLSVATDGTITFAAAVGSSIAAGHPGYRRLLGGDHRHDGDQWRHGDDGGNPDLQQCGDAGRGHGAGDDQQRGFVQLDGGLGELHGRGPHGERRDRPHHGERRDRRHESAGGDSPQQQCRDDPVRGGHGGQPDDECGRHDGDQRRRGDDDGRPDLQ